MIVIGGGDGTLHLAADALVESGLPVGVLPLGTANDLASTLSVPDSLDQACDVIARGHRVSIDMGWINGSYFFNAVNIGFAVELTRRMSREAKRRWGVGGYALAAMDALRAKHEFEAEVVCDGRTHCLRSMQITVGNGRHHGDGLTVAEHASISDHMLHLYSLQPMSIWKLLALIPALRQGRQHRSDRVDTLDGKEIEIRTEHPMRVIADGEFSTHTPARIRLLPDALSVFTPMAPDEAMGPG